MVATHLLQANPVYCRRITEGLSGTALPARRSAGLLLDMISDREIWQAAGAMIKRYGDDAATEAAKRADELFDEGDADGYAIWRRIMQAVEGLSGTEPEGKVN